MADNDKSKFDLPWGTLLPLLAVLAGVIAQYKPLVSTRPPVPSEKAIPVTAKQDVDSKRRLRLGMKSAPWPSFCATVPARFMFSCLQ